MIHIFLVDWHRVLHLSRYSEEDLKKDLDILNRKYGTNSSKEEVDLYNKRAAALDLIIDDVFSKELTFLIKHTIRLGGQINLREVIQKLVVDRTIGRAELEKSVLQIYIAMKKFVRLTDDKRQEYLSKLGPKIAEDIGIQLYWAEKVRPYDKSRDEADIPVVAFDDDDEDFKYKYSDFELSSTIIDDIEAGLVEFDLNDPLSYMKKDKYGYYDEVEPKVIDMDFAEKALSYAPFSIHQTAGAKLYAATYQLKKSAKNWASILSKGLNYGGIIDPGYGIIHQSEPTQAVFFPQNKTLNIVKAITLKNGEHYRNYVLDKKSEIRRGYRDLSKNASLALSRLGKEPVYDIANVSIPQNMLLDALWDKSTNSVTYDGSGQGRISQKDLQEVLSTIYNKNTGSPGFVSLNHLSVKDAGSTWMLPKKLIIEKDLIISDTDFDTEGGEGMALLRVRGDASIRRSSIKFPKMGSLEGKLNSTLFVEGDLDLVKSNVNPEMVRAGGNCHFIMPKGQLPAIFRVGKRLHLRDGPTSLTLRRSSLNVAELNFSSPYFLELLNQQFLPSLQKLLGSDLNQERKKALEVFEGYFDEFTREGTQSPSGGAVRLGRADGVLPFKKQHPEIQALGLQLGTDSEVSEALKTKMKDIIPAWAGEHSKQSAITPGDRKKLVQWHAEAYSTSPVKMGEYAGFVDMDVERFLVLLRYYSFPTLSSPKAWSEIDDAIRSTGLPGPVDKINWTKVLPIIKSAKGSYSRPTPDDTDAAALSVALSNIIFNSDLHKKESIAGGPEISEFLEYILSYEYVGVNACNINYGPYDAAGNVDLIDYMEQQYDLIKNYHKNLNAKIRVGWRTEIKEALVAVTVWLAARK